MYQLPDKLSRSPLVLARTCESTAEVKLLFYVSDAFFFVLRNFVLHEEKHTWMKVITRNDIRAMLAWQCLLGLSLGHAQKSDDGVHWYACLFLVERREGQNVSNCPHTGWRIYSYVLGTN